MEQNTDGLVHGVDPHKVRAVVFDLGGVFLEGTIENIMQFGAKVGLSEEEWLQVRREVFGPKSAWDQLERGEISLDTFAEELQGRVAAHGIELDLRRARTFMGSPSDTLGSRIRPEIVDACAAVKKVMPTALLTNNIVEWREGWQSRVDVDALFDAAIDSSEVGMRKPEPRIYKLMESKLGKPGEELLFIDDMGVNLKGARNMGWQTLKYDDTAKVLSVLDAVIAAGGK